MPGRWSLILNDGFHGTSLDRRLWNTQYPWGEDNNGDGSENCYLSDNVSLDGDSHVVLTGRRGTIRGNGSNGKPMSWRYSSGQINTFGTFSLEHGAVEMRGKLPSGPGSWPAFWALPVDGSWPPEIDFMEVYGHTPNALQMTYYGKAAHGRVQQFTKATRPGTSTFSQGYHVFGCAISPEEITWYLDGVPQWTFANRKAIDQLKPLYLVCNLAIGGIGGNPAENTWPQRYTIDYVRAWRPR